PAATGPAPPEAADASICNSDDDEDRFSRCDVSRDVHVDVHVHVTRGTIPDACAYPLLGFFGLRGRLYRVAFDHVHHWRVDPAVVGAEAQVAGQAPEGAGGQRLQHVRTRARAGLARAAQQAHAVVGVRLGRVRVLAVG